MSFTIALEKLSTYKTFMSGSGLMSITESGVGIYGMGAGVCSSDKLNLTCIVYNGMTVYQ